MALSADDQAWRDAYYIAYIGASNPRGVRRTLDIHAAVLGAEHVAVRAIRGHLDYLEGHGLGPGLADLGAVRDNACRLGMVDGDGTYLGDALANRT